MARIGSEILQASQAIIQNFQRQQQQQLAAISLEANIKQAKKNFELKEEEFRIREEKMRIEQEQFERKQRLDEQTEQRQQRSAQDKLLAIQLNNKVLQARVDEISAQTKEERQAAAKRRKAAEAEEKELDIQIKRKTLKAPPAGEKRRLPELENEELMTEARSRREMEAINKEAQTNTDFKQFAFMDLAMLRKERAALSRSLSSAPVIAAKEMAQFFGGKEGATSAEEEKLRLLNDAIKIATEATVGIEDDQDFLFKVYQNMTGVTNINEFRRIMLDGVKSPVTSLKEIQGVPQDTPTLFPMAVLKSFKDRDFRRLLSLTEANLVTVDSNGVRNIDEAKLEKLYNALQANGLDMSAEEFDKFSIDFMDNLTNPTAATVGPVPLGSF